MKMAQLILYEDWMLLAVNNQSSSIQFDEAMFFEGFNNRFKLRKEKIR